MMMTNLYRSFSESIPRKDALKNSSLSLSLIVRDIVHALPRVRRYASKASLEQPLSAEELEESILSCS